MDIYVDKNSNRIEWSVDDNTVVICNNYVSYAFKHGKKLLMVKERYESSEVGFTIYDSSGNSVISYKYLGDNFTYRGVNIVDVNGMIISADYEEEKKNIVILKEFEKSRSLLIYGKQGDFVAEIPSPQGYTFISLKNCDGNIMVVARGTNDITKDSFGRNDWNFEVDLENFYVQKKSVIE